MTATAKPEAKGFDWKLWIPAVAAPVACFLADYVAGEYILRFAPAALLSLAGIGIAALVLSRNQSQGMVGLAAVGPLWLVGGLTLALGTLLAVISIWGLQLSFFALLGLRREAPLFLLWALLGFTPFWTGVTYLREAHGLTKHQAAAHGALQTGLAATAGAMIAACIVVGAHAMDSRLLAMRVEALDTRDPEAWQAALSDLSAYSLCGRRRCKERVCNQVVRLFPPSLGKSTLAVPAPIDNAFKQAFGVSAKIACM